MSFMTSKNMKKLVKLSDKTKKALDSLCSRWSCNPSRAIRQAIENESARLEELEHNAARYEGIADPPSGEDV